MLSWRPLTCIDLTNFDLKRIYDRCSSIHITFDCLILGDNGFCLIVFELEKESICKHILIAYYFYEFSSDTILFIL